MDIATPRTFMRAARQHHFPPPLPPQAVPYFLARSFARATAFRTTGIHVQPRDIAQRICDARTALDTGRGGDTRAHALCCACIVPSAAHLTNTAAPLPTLYRCCCWRAAAPAPPHAAAAAVCIACQLAFLPLPALSLPFAETAAGCAHEYFSATYLPARQL